MRCSPARSSHKKAKGETSVSCEKQDAEVFFAYGLDKWMPKICIFLNKGYTEGLFFAIVEPVLDEILGKFREIQENFHQMINFICYWTLPMEQD